MAWGDYFGGRGQQTPRVATGPRGADRAGPGDLGVNRGRQPGLFGSRGAAAMGAPSYVPSRAGNVRDAFNTGIDTLKGPAMWAMEKLGGATRGIQKNQMQADWLKNTYYGGDTKARDLAYWDQAGKGVTGTDPSAAYNRLTRAGITRNDMDKFLGKVPSKWTGNEAWLRSQAHDTDLFNEAMPFIKNAKATNKLYTDLQAAESGAGGGVDFPFASGIAQEGGSPIPSYPTGPISAIDYGDPNLDDILYGEPTGEPEDIFGNIPEPGIYGRPDWDNLDSIYDFERQRQKAAFSPKLLAEDRAHPTIPLGRRTFTASPIEVDYPFGLDDDISPLPLGSNAALAARGYWEPNITPIFEDDEELTPAQLYNPRIE